MDKTVEEPIVFDLKGKLNQIHLSPSNALLPVYEAIVNSIHSTQYSGIEKGLIEIFLYRNEKQLLLDTDEVDVRPITKVKIRDNGIGFNHENYTSFRTANSTHKVDVGGKGVGRFTWLKAFERVSIESIYKNGSGNHKRKFEFSPVGSGINNHEVESSLNEPRRTEVFLHNLFPKYSINFPIDTNVIAEKIIRHCMDYFVLKGCPTIVIIDENNNSRIVLNDLYKISIKKLDSKTLYIQDYIFELDVYKVLNIKTKHLLHYCANNREVYSKTLSKDIPELNRVISTNESDSKDFYIHGYIKGKYLNEIVNTERTAFNFPKIDEDDIDFNEELSESELRKHVISGIEKSISNFLKEVRQNKLDRIRKFVESKAPQYRTLFKYKKSSLQKLPILSEAKLEIELFKILHNLELELKKEGRTILKKIKSKEDFEKYQKDYNVYIEKVIDVGNTNLSKYIIHRKVVLSLLEKTFRKNKLGKFAKEAAVHRLIFPLNSTSDDLSYEEHNLWIIDEKLAYHSYLASDKQFSKIDTLDIKNPKRPDLISFHEYFDNHYAFATKKASPFQSIIIIELKRPMRDDYNEIEDNPISQTLDYVDILRSGKGKLKNGRKFNVKSVPIYCYIISDLTPKLEKIAKQYGYTITQDGEGYFGFNPEYSCYMEIISYDKLIDDAKQRNQILFDKLKLPLVDGEE